MVQLGFLMVGHTHEDIDALFSRFSEEIRTTQVFSFPHLMQKFNECTQTHRAPFVMQQVPNFKEFVKDYLHERDDKLVGHSKPLQFGFYMSQGIPLMQYKNVQQKVIGHQLKELNFGSKLKMESHYSL